MPPPAAPHLKAAGLPAAFSVDDRRAVLRAHGATAAVADELLAFAPQDVPPSTRALPLSDEACVEAWDGYAARAATRGLWPVLSDALVQLRFPIEAGVSATPAYRAATRQGVRPPPGPGLRLDAPDRLALDFLDTPAGRVPVLWTPVRADFEALLRALVHRNEPVPVPASMGAMAVTGFNNWDRVRAYEREWRATAGRTPGAQWAQAFQALVPQKHRYQDSFLLLGPGGYSGLPAAAVGRTEADWEARSRAIRLGHEGAHYVIRRLYGPLPNPIWEEILADYAGLTLAFGAFEGELLLRFLGLEAYPAYRPGARLENYRAGLSDEAFAVLGALVVAAMRRLEQIACEVGAGGDPYALLPVLALLPLEALAA